jgi:hypothetical protein
MIRASLFVLLLSAPAALAVPYPDVLTPATGFTFTYHGPAASILVDERNEGRDRLARYEGETSANWSRDVFGFWVWGHRTIDLQGERLTFLSQWDGIFTGGAVGRAVEGLYLVLGDVDVWPGSFVEFGPGLSVLAWSLGGSRSSGGAHATSITSTGRVLTRATTTRRTVTSSTG